MRSQSVRMLVEVSPDVLILHDHLKPQHLAGAADMLRQRLREALGGLSPIMGEDVLLEMCREVIAEDRPS